MDCTLWKSWPSVYHTRVLLHYRPERNLSLNHCPLPGHHSALQMQYAAFAFDGVATAAAEARILAWWQLYVSWHSCIETLCARRETSCLLMVTFRENKHLGKWKDIRLPQAKNSQLLCFVWRNYLHPYNRIMRIISWRTHSELFYAKSCICSTKLCVAELKPKHSNSPHLLFFNFYPFFICSELLTFEAYGFELSFRPRNCNSIAF